MLLYLTSGLAVTVGAGVGVSSDKEYKFYLHTSKKAVDCMHLVLVLPRFCMHDILMVCCS